ncbi:OB-fold-containig protein [Qipengyuania sphaerica]|uniref:OB-fold-containig protein n=1 Tax=Qipengyuania sphaerica TaxID=2867243 RepID=UPI001C87015E|nr:OB-fold-containig protein [Qipengyuania sphaerica]MBX7541658.1 YqiJ family protein [Qipengyuania sphaerica]
MTLLEPYNAPFAIALLLMAALLVIQVLGVLDIDIDIDTDGDGAISAGPVDGLLTLLGLGRVPLTVWLVVFLFFFAALGLGIQELAEGFTGGPLDAWLAGVLAGAAALPVTSLIARPLGRILPQDETSAVGIDTLVGRRAAITEGIARAGSPARARVKDVHGQSHYVMVEPHEGASEFHAGDEVLLVRREENTFYGTALAERRLSPARN